jgi:hypothetical protein
MTSSIYFGNNNIKHGVTFNASACYEGRGSGR